MRARLHLQSRKKVLWRRRFMKRSFAFLVSPGKQFFFETMMKRMVLIWTMNLIHLN
ncbi:hypothetical protein KC19_11G129900 [Ceratodon purpureus]|uniref:Uncharacterized protein n=1 Tax=Ceratodon purpureus TaxID=3225 RepID=A0A8T0GFK9_CERPU|nr:hypothetical protein KC19_11G129900 [Ceratodon purpureus]